MHLVTPLLDLKILYQFFDPLLCQFFFKFNDQCYTRKIEEALEDTYLIFWWGSSAGSDHLNLIKELTNWTKFLSVSFHLRFSPAPMLNHLSRILPLCKIWTLVHISSALVDYQSSKVLQWLCLVSLPITLHNIKIFKGF